jgi:hypothetical protein
MRYLVRAYPRIESIRRFWTLLNEGTVEKQRPDGQEIVASMQNAVIIDGRAEWTETCYCKPPLQHERSTVYDQFFNDIEIEPLESALKLEGERFWDYMRDHSTTTDEGSSEVKANVGMRYIPIRIL